MSPERFWEVAGPRLVGLEIDIRLRASGPLEKAHVGGLNN